MPRRSTMKSTLTLLTTLFLEPVVLPAAEPGAMTQAGQTPAIEDPRLPRVLIIGDSIRVGYTDEVRKLLAGKANIHRAAGKLDPPRQSDDVIKYNAVARRVMTEKGVAIDSLFAAALPRMADIQLPHNVHFTKEGSAELARHVAACIEAAMKNRHR